MTVAPGKARCRKVGSIAGAGGSDRVVLANKTDIRYHYEQPLLPTRIAANGRTTGSYEWQNTLRLVRYKDKETKN